MSTFNTHKELYLKFKEDALKTDLYPGTRVEAYFLSAFHLIETCAALVRVHINKHQNVRSVLEKEGQIFGKDTESVWKSFQKIENQLRPKFAYSAGWEIEDLKALEEEYRRIEIFALRKLEDAQRE